MNSLSIKRFSPPLFVLLCAVQILVPASIAFNAIKTASSGKVFSFAVEPFDPIDSFRGRYIIIHFDPLGITDSSGVCFERNENIYVEFYENEDGFARIKSLRKEPPPHDYYLKTIAVRNSPLRIRMPANRLYLNERLAPETERLYRDAVAGNVGTCRAQVAIFKGSAVLLDVLIDDVPIVEYVRRKLEEQ